MDSTTNTSQALPVSTVQQSIPMDSNRPFTNSSPSTKPIIYIVVAAVVVGFVLLIVLLATRNSAATPQTPGSSTPQAKIPVQTPTSTPVVTDVSKDQQYSDDYISFSYPQGWKAEVKSGPDAVQSQTESKLPGVSQIKISNGSDSFRLLHNPGVFGYGPGETTLNLDKLGTATISAPDEADQEYKMGNILYFKRSTVLDRYVFVFSAKPKYSDGNELTSRVVFGLDSLSKANSREITLDIEYPDGAIKAFSFMGNSSTASDKRYANFLADTDAKSQAEAKTFVENIEKLVTSAQRK